MKHLQLIQNRKKNIQVITCLILLSINIDITYNDNSDTVKKKITLYFSYD